MERQAVILLLFYWDIMTPCKSSCVNLRKRHCLQVEIVLVKVGARLIVSFDVYIIGDDI